MPCAVGEDCELNEHAPALHTSRATVLEAAAAECSMHDVVFRLRKAKLAWMRALSAIQNTKFRQGDIRAFFVLKTTCVFLDWR